jgi:flagellar biosynthesis anti-sigma factor FlgM
MKVSGKTSGVGATPGTTAAKPAENVQPSGTSQPQTVQDDALSVSGSAQFIAVAKAELDKIPDIRTDKVEAIKAKIDSDDYNPPAEAVAEGLMREHTPPAAHG